MNQLSFKTGLKEETMGTALHALMVEDNENDLRMMVRALTQGGYEVTYLQVEDDPGLRRALLEEVWDVIFIDFNLPRFSALDALKVMRAMNVDIPRIVVSGTMGEDSAVEVMRAGAHDFITKGNLSRLIPVLQRELADSLERRAHGRSQEALRQSEEQFKRIFDQGHLGMAMVAFNGRLLKVNKAFGRLLGYSEAEMMSKSFQDFTHPDDRDDNQQMVTELFEGRIPAFNLEKKYIRKDGQAIWADLYVSIVLDSKDAPLFAVALVQDVTERHRINEALRDSEERFRGLSEAALEGIAFHREGRILDANLGFIRMLGYSLEELGRIGLEGLLAPQSREKWEKRLLAPEGPPFWVQVKRKNGSVLPVEVNTRTVTFRNLPTVAVVIQNHTASKEAEKSAVG